MCVRLTELLKFNFEGRIKSKNIIHQRMMMRMMRMMRVLLFDEIANRLIALGIVLLF